MPKRKSRGRITRVVLDTCVVVGHVVESRRDCADAIRTVNRRQHRVLLSGKLLDEYQRKLTGGDPRWQRLFLTELSQKLVDESLFQFEPDPKVEIAFGPEEDRFHLQLAVSGKARFHVSQDGGVLAVSPVMRNRYGVLVMHPQDYSDHCR